MASKGRNPGARVGLRLAAVAVGALALAPATAGAHTYTVQPGDTLYGIGSVNGQSAQTVAAASGRSLYALLPVGATVVVPDGVSTVGTTSTSTSTSSTATQNVPTGGSGVVPVPAASGTAYLRSDAASALSGLSQASRRRLGTAVYPAGPMSGWRSYATQLALWRAYQAGVGPVAAYPGTSAHELGTAMDLATPAMRTAVDTLGSTYGWQKTEAPTEWWHVNYVR